MNLNVIIREADSTVQDAIEVLKEKNQRSVLVSHKGEVVGLVSKTDNLYKVTYEGRNPSKVRLREIMTSPVLAVDPKSTVKDALELMNKKNVRQLMVHACLAVGPAAHVLCHRPDAGPRAARIEYTYADPGRACLIGAASCVSSGRTGTGGPQTWLDPPEVLGHPSL